MPINSDTVLERLAHSLGEPDGRWHIADGAIHVVRFHDQPIQGTVTFTTIGLSDRLLTEERGSQIRQELLLAVKAKQESDRLPILLAFLAGVVALRAAPLQEFEALGIETAIRPAPRMTGVLFSTPVYHTDQIHVITATTPPTVVVWAIPIYGRELDAVRRVGWQAIEARFSEQDPDLTDLGRASVL